MRSIYRSFAASSAQALLLTSASKAPGQIRAHICDENYITTQVWVLIVLSMACILEMTS